MSNNYVLVFKSHSARYPHSDYYSGHPNQSIRHQIITTCQVLFARKFKEVGVKLRVIVLVLLCIETDYVDKKRDI